VHIFPACPTNDISIIVFLCQRDRVSYLQRTVVYKKQRKKAKQALRRERERERERERDRE